MARMKSVSILSRYFATLNRRNMENLLYRLHTGFFSLTGILLVCTVLLNPAELAGGSTGAQACWFHFVMLFAGAGLLWAAITVKGKLQYRFSIADGCLALYLAVMLLTYNWQLNPAPYRLLFWLQGGILWFYLRIGLMNFPGAGNVFPVILTALGSVEAVWGIAQGAGLLPSGHSLYNLTGSFFNPGPYSGFLAVLLPIALNGLFVYRDKSSRIKQTLRYLSVSTVCLILAVLPAGMSRTAWISAFVSACWVIGTHFGVAGRFAARGKKHTIRLAGILTACALIGAIALTGLLLIKKDSVSGRFLIWKITARALLEEPFKGSGLGSFAGTYAGCQSVYFQSGQGNKTEKRVAGSPEYAFNEYIQIGKEQGIGGLLLFTAWLTGGLVQAARKHRAGIGGAILSLAVFAFGSYPLQLPAFGILLIFLISLAETPISFYSNNTSCVFDTRGPGEATLMGKGRPPLLFFFPGAGMYSFVILLALAGWLLYGRQKENYRSLQEWSRLQQLHYHREYKQATEGYAALYPHLGAYPSFLFEYARCLAAQQRHQEAIAVLNRACRLSGDPMIYNVMAKSYLACGEYRQAEKWLLKSVWLLPERIYPYYLLTRLYAEPAFYNPFKMRQAAAIVLSKKPKVESEAVAEMKKKAGRLTEYCTGRGNNQF